MENGDYEDICLKCKQDIILDDFDDFDFKSKEEAMAYINGHDDLKGIDEFSLDIFTMHDRCEHSKCNCVPPKNELSDYIVYNHGPIFNDPSNYLKSIIHLLEKEEPVDWHPGSNQQVRDIIHPSLYCYVKGVSRFNDGTVEPYSTVDSNNDSKKYLWLPSEFKVNANRSVSINTYINNLDENKYLHLKFNLEVVFQSFLPSLEKVLETNLTNTNLQVITKIASIHLDKTKPEYPGGSWHIEGTLEEYIVATCLYYVEVNGITDSFLEFRKPVFLNEENIDYPQSDDVYTTIHYGIEPGSHHDGQMNRYLGLIKCVEGRSVVFPNTLQHRVTPFKLEENKQEGTRSILVFFVVDPKHRTVSTQDIPPQQDIFTIEEANHYRERLMYHRKYFVDSLNKEVYERPYSLCEH